MYLLILANFPTILGVVFFNWSVFEILFLYWCESAIIAFYTLLKFILLLDANEVFSEKKNIIGIFGLVLFFVIHFGGFMWGHFTFLEAFFAPKTEGVRNVSIIDYTQLVVVPLLVLFFSHGISFLIYLTKDIKHKAVEITTFLTHTNPYKRIFVMHLTIIFGAFLVILIGESTPALVCLILAKIYVDAKADIRKHAVAEPIVVQ